MARSLFLALALPDDYQLGDDPDDYADDIVRILNRGRCAAAAAAAIFASGDIETAARAVEPIMVSGIPSPQWLTPATLAALRRAARS